MLIENLVSGAASLSSAAVGALALYNISKERHSFFTVLAFHFFGAPKTKLASSSSESAPGIWAAIHRIFTPSKEDQMPQEPSSKEQILSPREKALIAKESAQMKAPKVSRTDIFSAYQNRAVVLACIIGLLASIDPLGVNNIYSPATFMALLFTQIFLGYIIQSFWCYAWVTLMMEFLQIQRKKLLKAIFYVLISVNFLSTFFIILFMHVPGYPIEQSVSIYAFSFDWILSSSFFAVISTIVASRTIAVLEESAAYRQSDSKKESIERKMRIANSSFILSVLISLIPLIFQFPRRVALRREPLPGWFCYSLLVFLPHGWAIILAFNWKRKAEADSNQPDGSKSKLEGSKSKVEDCNSKVELV